MRIIQAVVCVAILVMTCWCGIVRADPADPEVGRKEKTLAEKPKAATGAILASDGGGILAIDVETGKWKRLVIRRADPLKVRLTNPAFSTKTKTLFYVDGISTGIMSWKSGEAEPKLIYRLHAVNGIIRERPWLLLNGDETRLYFPEKQGKPARTRKLLSCELSTGKISVVSKKYPNFSHLRPAWIDANHLFTTKFIDGETKLGSFDLTKGDFTPLEVVTSFRDFALSSTGSRLLVEDDKRTYHIYEFPGLKELKKIDDDTMPGDTGGKISFVGEDHLVMYRDSGTWRPVGLVLVDIRTGKSRKLAMLRAEGFVYLPEMPDWAPGE